jgi:hypothetical protein
MTTQKKTAASKESVTEPKRKTWNSYEDYLKSDKWKQVKADFYANYQGPHNRCEITGNSYEPDNDDNPTILHLHHFRYPKDWNDDSWENIILISQDLHADIHFNESPLYIEPKQEFKNKDYFKVELLELIDQNYNIEIDLCYDQINELNNKLEKQSIKINQLPNIMEIKAEKQHYKELYKMIKKLADYALKEVEELKAANNG